MIHNRLGVFCLSMASLLMVALAQGASNSTKPGTCPFPQFRWTEVCPPDDSSFQQLCQDDSQCPGDQKCCSYWQIIITDCYVCLPPEPPVPTVIETSVTATAKANTAVTKPATMMAPSKPHVTHPALKPNGTKPGTCPYPQFRWGETCPPEDSAFQQLCQDDSQCPGDQKCCSYWRIMITDCYVCLPPVPPVPVVTKPTTAPTAKPKISKEGLCPEFQLNTTNGANASFSFDCLSDSECSYDHKCCLRPDGVYRCTEPLPNNTHSTMRPTTHKIVKPGQCPRPRFGLGRICPVGTACNQDGDCAWNMKCCNGTQSIYCSSICMYPDFNVTTTSTMRPASTPSKPSKPPSKPHHDHVGSCPNNYAIYTAPYSWNGGITCANHCNSSDDCADGDLCCVENPWPSDISRCPRCMKAKIDCDGGHKHGEIYHDYYQSWSICQCFYGKTSCYNFGDNDDDDDYYSHGPYLYLPRVWIAPVIAASSALLLSMLFTLSVCCCMKCCCKGKPKASVLPQQVPPVAQQPRNIYYVPAPKDDKIPLTESGYTTA